MAATLRAGTAYVDILPKIGAGFGKQLESDLKGDAEGVGKSTGSTLGGSIKSAALLALGAAGIGGGLALFKGFIDEGNEARAVAAQTAAVIKSTGGAAGVSAKQVSDLSNAISKKVGIDDEAIASGENLVLTFTGIRNEVGKGNDIFTQSTQVITDMSVALGQDMKSSAIQVGKALNDPIKGVTALQRVGVSFTEQQKDQIKTLVESGHSLDAQKLILAELTKEFGGSAAAQDTAGKNLSVTWKNIQEQLGTVLLPILDKVATFIGVALPEAIHIGAEAVDFIKEHIDIIAPVIGGLAIAIAVVLAPAFIAWAVAAGTAAAATIVAAAPVIAITLAIAALAAGIIYAYTHFQIFHDIVNTVADVFKLEFQIAIGIAKTLIGDLISLVKTIIRVVTDVVTIVVDLAHGDWRGAWNAFKDIPMAIIDFFVDFVKRRMDFVVDIFGGMPDRLKKIAGNIFGFLTDSFKGAINWIIDQWNNFKIPGIEILGHQVSPEINFPNIPRLHTGIDRVPGAPGSEMLAILQAGERVTPAGQADGKTFQILFTGPVHEPINIQDQFERMEWLAG